MTQPLNLVFMGSPDFAVPSLRALASQHQIRAVYTQPPRRKGRGMKLQPTAVGQVADELGLDCFWPDSLKDSDVQKQLASHQADLFIVVAYGLLLPQPVLDIPRLGCVNGHASLLPRWRGAAPIHRAIEAGDSQTGVTAMMMQAGLDTGPMLNRQSVAITDDMTTGMLHDVLAEMTAECLIGAASELAAGTARPEAQDDSQAVYAAKITNEETKLDFSMSASELSRKIRAFQPFPGAWGDMISGRLKILMAEAVSVSRQASETASVGHYHGIDSEGRMQISCGEGLLAVSMVQPAGKTRMPARDFINGQNWQDGQKVILG